MNVDLQLHHLRHVAGSGNAFASGFAKSILKQARRPGWQPSEKQAAIMERLVAEALHPDDGCVIEE